MFSRRSRNEWIPDGYLPRSLLLTAQPDLSVHSGSVDVSAGAPYRIIGERGSIVRIEVLMADGTVVSGYTVSGRLLYRRRSKWKWWRRS